jgi:hypothetical protein
MTMAAVTGAIFSHGRPAAKKASPAVQTAMAAASAPMPSGRTNATAAPTTAPVAVPIARSRATVSTPPPTLAWMTTMAEMTLQYGWGSLSAVARNRAAEAPAAICSAALSSAARRGLSARAIVSLAPEPSFVLGLGDDHPQHRIGRQLRRVLFTAPHKP